MHIHAQIQECRGEIILFHILLFFTAPQGKNTNEVLTKFITFG